MLAAILCNLQVLSTGRSAASRYWYAAPLKQLDEVVQKIVIKNPAPEVRDLWSEVADMPDIEERLRSAATFINLAVSHQEAEEGLRLMRQVLQEIEDEETFTMLFH